MRRFFSILCCCCYSVALLGCGSSSTPPQYPVEGTVMLDSSPLKEGKIIFVEDDGRPPEGGDISNGTFAFKVRAGTKRVQIFAFRPGPPAMPDQTEPSLVNYLPE